MRRLQRTLAAACALCAAAPVGIAGSIAAIDPAPPASPMPCCAGASAEKAPARPTIHDVAFLAGDWTGQRPGRDGPAHTQEVWSAPAGNNMVGMFRWVNADGSPAVFEILTITEEDDTLVLRLRHQDATGNAWEAQDQPATLHLTRLTPADAESDAPTIVEFTDTGGSCDLASCTYDRSIPDKLVITVAFDDPDREDLVFDLSRTTGVAAARPPEPVGTESPSAAVPLAPETARAIYERFQALDGEWIGRSTRGWEERIVYQTVAAGSVVVERSFDAHPGEQMYTMVHMDADRLMLTHYCVAQNQPRLVCTAWDEQARAATFEFLDGTGMASRDVGHMDKVIIRFIDDAHLATRWTWYQDGVESWMEEITLDRAGE